MTTPKELAEEFRRLAAKAREIANRDPWDCSRGPDVWAETARNWEQAAQMVENKLGTSEGL